MVLRGLLIYATVAAAAAFCAGQADVRVEPSHLQGPRQLQEQTQAAVVRDYLQAWKTVGTALDKNDSGLLDRDFIGTARDKLAGGIQQQSALGIHTNRFLFAGGTLHLIDRRRSIRCGGPRP
jgi:hypothetical protein